MRILKSGSKIIPYNSANGHVGQYRLSTIDLKIYKEDILGEIEWENERYLRLSLGENRTQFDSYLVEESLLEEANNDA
ncbi:MAG: hypothetical protein Tsb0034_11210 [Ekhidna sp.]